MYYAVRTMHAELALQQHPLVGPGPGTDPAGLAWGHRDGQIISHLPPGTHTTDHIFQRSASDLGSHVQHMPEGQKFNSQQGPGGQAIGRSNPRMTLKRGGLINKTLMPETVSCRPWYVVVGVGSAAGWCPQVRNHRPHCCCCHTTGRYTAHLTDFRVKLVWEGEKNVLVSYFPKQPDASYQRESRFFLPCSRFGLPAVPPPKSQLNSLRKPQ